MPTDNELQRLAMAANAIRPEWPVRSLLTLLTKHAARPYRDLAVALAWIATDAQTKTPARLSEAGPWWTATSMTEGQGPTQSRMRCAIHGEHHAGHCPECVAAAVPKPAGFVVPLRPRKRAFVPEGPPHAPTKPAVDLEYQAHPPNPGTEFGCLGCGTGCDECKSRTATP